MGNVGPMELSSRCGNELEEFCAVIFMLFARNLEHTCVFLSQAPNNSETLIQVCPEKGKAAHKMSSRNIERKEKIVIY